MADVNNTPDQDRTMPDVAWTDADPAMAPRKITDADHLLTARSHAAPVGTIAALDDPDLARAQIEATRARMSETLEEIEERLSRKKQELLQKKDELLQKKEELTDRLDVMRPIREKVRDNSWAALGGVFAAGLVLGLLTGGGEDEEEEARPAVREFTGRGQPMAGHEQWQDRSRTWENRARRLMMVANEQELELERLRGAPRPERYTMLDRVRPSRRRERRLRDALAEGLAEGLADVVDAQAHTTAMGYDGMPLHDADSQPPRDEELRGGPYQRDPIPSPT